MGAQLLVKVERLGPVELERPAAQADLGAEALDQLAGLRRQLAVAADEHVHGADALLERLVDEAD